MGARASVSPRRQAAAASRCFPLGSFSVPAFDSLIIVGTNNISEQSLTEINLKVRPVWARPADGPLTLGVSGERDRRGRSGNPPGHLYRAAVAGLRVQGEARSSPGARRALLLGSDARRPAVLVWSSWWR